MRLRFVLAVLVAILLTGCGSAAGPTVGNPRTATPTTSSRATAAPPLTSATSTTHEPADSTPAPAATYAVTINGRTVELPFEVSFAARKMPPANVGREVARFKREGTAAVEVLETPFRGRKSSQAEFAFGSGDFTSTNPKAGIIQVVTNFGMWRHVPNGPSTASQFPTHVGELVPDRDGYDLVYYMDAHLMLNEMTLESVPNLFVSHSSGLHSLRIIRVGTIKVRFGNGGSSVSGEIDLIGWAVTAGFATDPLEYAKYRYLATFTGELQT